MKYTILIPLTVSIGLLSFNESAVATVAMQNGFYLGVDVGAANLMDKESHSVNAESHQLGDVGVVGGGFFGYDHCLTQKTRIAIEGFIDALGSQTSIQHAGNTYKMNQQYNAGVRLLPAYLFTPYTLGHLILGYANGRFQIKDNGVYGLVNTRYNKSGFQTGLGLATALPHNFLIRLDALYTLYGSNTNRGTGLPGAPASQFYTNRFSQLAGELALYYKFT